MNAKQLFNLYRKEMLKNGGWIERDVILNYTNINYTPKYNMLTITKAYTLEEQARENLKAIYCNYRIDWHQFV